MIDLPYRIAPLAPSDLTPPQREIAKSYVLNGELLNSIKVFVRNLPFFTSYKKFAIYTMARSRLPRRWRELCILRVAILTKCDYEWGHHVRLAGEAGLMLVDIQRVREGPDADGWPDEDQLILRAVDELIASSTISDTTFESLQTRLDPRVLFDLVLTVGNYGMVCSALKALRIPNDLGCLPISASIESVPS